MDVFSQAKEKLGKPYEDLEFLLNCFAEVLIENKENQISKAIPWINPTLDIQSIQVTEKHLHLFSISFQLLNLIEVNGAVQNRRKVEDDTNMVGVNGLWANSLLQLKNAGIDEKIIAANLGDIHIEPVLTAHPTEAKRPVVLEHYRQLYLLLVKRENKMYTHTEQNEIRRDIKIQLHRLWHIGEIFIEKPNVISELDNIIHYMVNVFAKVIPMLDRRLIQAWTALGFNPDLLDDLSCRPRISFGNWVGGDRDGHPLVTAEITKYTLLELRLKAILLVKEQLNELSHHFSIYYSKNSVSTEFHARLAKLTELLGDEGEQLVKKYENEAFRLFINLLDARLPINTSTGSHIELKDKRGSYKYSKELIEDLEYLRKEMIVYGAETLAANDVVNTIRLVETFGFFLARVDIRQNSRFHEMAFVQLLNASMNQGEEFISLSEEKKLKFLDTELSMNRPFLRIWNDLPNEAQSLLECYHTVEEHISRYTSNAIGSLIVSMTRKISDLLLVYLLTREAGLTLQKGVYITCKLPVVPLFETIDDLLHSADILDQFLSHPVTKNSLLYKQIINGSKDLSQDVMIGYSDSNKDGGILASSWELYNAQIKMAETGRKHGVRIRFFHGKGGTISRGAGPLHWFIKTLPHSTICGDIRITEQGETIERKYANNINAAYNLELLLAGTACNTILQKYTPQKEHSAASMFEYIANESMKVYLDLTNNKHFIQFFEQATPIDAIESSKIGSRPARRTGQRTLADLRAIPWVFSWSQTRYNLTSWYGVGTTLENMLKNDPEKFEQLKSLVPGDAFVRYVLTNIDTSLAATDENIMREYAELVTDAECRKSILNLLLEEYHRTITILNILLPKSLEERRKNHYYSTILRAEPLTYLHKSQILLLKQWRKQRENNEDQAAESTLLNLLRCVNAIANAMGTTG